MDRKRLKDIDFYAIGNTLQIAGAVFADANEMYLLLLPGEEADRELHLLDLDHDEWKSFLRQSDLKEVEILTKASDGSKAKAILRKSARQISQGVSWAVFRRAGFKCEYCGADDVPLTVDHLVLWEHNGPSIEENLKASCRRCNKARGNTLYADWLNHPYYLKVSRNLDEATRKANIAVAATLDGIPRRLHGSSR